MMTSFILWITLMTATGPELSTAEFYGRDACEKAAQMYKAVNEDRFGFKVTAICTPKG